MNIVNRILVVVGTLLGLVTVSTIGLITLGLLKPEDLLASPWDQGLMLFAQLAPGQGWRVLGICVILILLGVLLIAIELRPQSLKDATLLVKQDGLGQITVAVASIQDLVSREAGQVTGVMDTSTQVKDSPTGMHLHCRLSVDPTSNVPDLTTEVQERLKKAVEHYVGKPVEQVHLNTQVAPLRQSTRKGRRLR